MQDVRLILSFTFTPTICPDMQQQSHCHGTYKLPSLAVMTIESAIIVYTGVFFYDFGYSYVSIK